MTKATAAFKKSQEEVEEKFTPKADPVPEVVDGARADAVIGFDEVTGEPITAAESFFRGGAVTPDEKHPRGFKLFKADHSREAGWSGAAVERSAERDFKGGENFDTAKNVDEKAAKKK